MGRKHRGGTACNLNEGQEDDYHGHGRRNVKEDTTGDAVKVGWGSISQNLESRLQHPHRFL